MADEVLCGGAVDWCRCILPPHERSEPHKCSCGGSWKWVAGKFFVIAIPSLTHPELPQDREDAGDGGRW